MNKDLIEFYESKKQKIEREIQDLNEVGRKSPKRVKIGRASCRERV